MQATNDALLAVALARSLDEDLRRVRAELARVLELADTGAANRPLLRD